MKPGRVLLAALLAIAGISVTAQPADMRPVRVVVPAPPGGNLDNTARNLFTRLARVNGEHYVIENRPGANTQIGVEAVVRAAPDGRTLLYAGTSVVFVPLLQKVPFSPLEDLAPVAQVSVDHLVLVSAVDGPVLSARELSALAAARPGGLNCAAYPGASTLGCEQLKQRVGGRLTTVPFPGVAPALASLMGGHTDVLFVNSEPVAQLMRASKLRVVAQSQAGARVGAGAPGFAELWPEFMLDSFAGVLAPAGTPPARIAQLNRDINRVVQDPEFANEMRAAGQEPAGGSSSQYLSVLQRAYQRYGELIRRLGLAPK